MDRGTARRDIVDGIVDDWTSARRDLDVEPLGVFSRIRRIAKQLDNERKRVFAESGLEPWEFDVLASLRRAGPPHSLSPKRLLETNLVSSGTMTNRVDRLVDRGLVRRELHPDDRRGVLVRMTPEGLARVDDAFTRLVEVEHRRVAGLDGRQRAELSALLRTLALSMELDRELPGA